MVSKLGVALLVVATAAAPRARADDDYDPRSTEWNGLAGFVAIAADEEMHLETPGSIDLSQLGAGDALILVYPTGELPLRDLTAFMRAGGQVVLCDDFGSGDALLSLFSIGRRSPAPGGAPRLRGNDNLLVARARLHHELARGVPALVANHPATVRHAELTPVFAFGESPEGLVVTGAVGEGRLVVVSDPSMLINNMLRFRGNERFARNLASYLSSRGGRHFVLATGSTPIEGSFGDPGGRPLEQVQRWLQEIANAEAPPLALLLGALVIAAIMLVIAVSALPRRSPYDGAAMFPQRAPAGGFVGRVQFFRDRPRNLLHPVLVYKFELEGELVKRLALGGRALLRDVLAALRDRGLPEQDVGAVRALLLELDDLRRRQDHPPGPPRVTEGRFREMVQTGERILERLKELDR